MTEAARVLEVHQLGEPFGGLRLIGIIEVEVPQGQGPSFSRHYSGPLLGRVSFLYESRYRTIRNGFEQFAACKLHESHCQIVASIVELDSFF